MNKYEETVNLDEISTLIKLLKNKLIRLQEYEDAASLRNMERKYNELFELKTNETTS